MTATPRLYTLSCCTAERFDMSALRFGMNALMTSHAERQHDQKIAQILAEAAVRAVRFGRQVERFTVGKMLASISSWKP